MRGWISLFCLALSGCGNMSLGSFDGEGTDQDGDAAAPEQDPIAELSGDAGEVAEGELAADHKAKTPPQADPKPSPSAKSPGPMLDKSVEAAPGEIEVDAGSARPGAPEQSQLPGCPEICELGESVCSAGEIIRCETRDGCLAWSDVVQCETGVCESDSACGGCDDECDAGDTLCEAGRLQSCELGEGGCNTWSEAEECELAACADDASCKLCEDECSEALECPFGDPIQCLFAPDGCWRLERAECEAPPPALRSPGQSCARSGECDSEVCMPTATNTSVCCQSLCGAGQVCRPDGDGCEPAPVCVTGQERCLNGHHEGCAAGQWSSLEQCGSAGCDVAQGGCLSEPAEEPQCPEGGCQEPPPCDPDERSGLPCLPEEPPACLGGECEEVPLLGQGLACGAGADCDSGFCVDGVCCENACDGACMECAASTGLCNVTPPTDTACGPVDCSAFETECSESPDLEPGQCAGLGQCRDATLCEAVHAPRGTVCGTSPMVCDGQGQCEEPAVDCGDSSCTTGSTGDMCCFDEANELACVESSADCGPYGAWLLQCDEHADCAAEGQLCCAQTGPGIRVVTCTPAEDCNLVAPGGFSSVELCASPRMEEKVCESGGACDVTEAPMEHLRFCRYVP